MKEIMDSVKMYVNFRKYGIKPMNENDSFFSGEVWVLSEGNVSEIWSRFAGDEVTADYPKDISPEAGILIDVEVSPKITGVLSRVQYNPFWSRPSFEQDMRMIPDNVQNMLLRTEKGYLSVLPICTKNYYACINHSENAQTVRIALSPEQTGVGKMSGVSAIIAESEDAYEAVHQSYQYASEKGYIKTPMRNRKHLPDIYRGLGWCTWNAFYQDVTESKIIAKMEEFQKKNIPIQWVMIDDGWTEVSGKNRHRISSLYEDRKKFPYGLKHCIDILKNKYQVAAVGVWHSMTGYWFGIERNSLLYCERKNQLTETNAGHWIPAAEESYKFFCDWYRYLKGQGVDFVKIDTQGNMFQFLNGRKNCVCDSVTAQMQMDKAVDESFRGNVINCMGMSNLNACFRPYSSLMRMSDDFLPDKKNSFKEHLLQNIYNSVFLSELYYCDFDMWWSKHPTAKQSWVLRAISGGPMYLSDKRGGSDGAFLKKLLDEKGEMRVFCDRQPKITEEDLFRLPKNRILRVDNQMQGKQVMALFNLSSEPQTVQICGNYESVLSEKCVNGEIVLDGNEADLYIEK